MDNHKKQDLEKIFKAGGDAICLPSDNPQNFTQFLNENEDLALRLGGVLGRSEQVVCDNHRADLEHFLKYSESICKNCQNPVQ